VCSILLCVVFCCAVCCIANNKTDRERISLSMPIRAFASFKDMRGDGMGWGRVRCGEEV
jgi:heterodisulfide reductase subunit A-like polyferredoxin